MNAKIMRFVMAFNPLKLLFKTFRLLNQSVASQSAIIKAIM